MVKIIKKGKLPEETVHQVSCAHCSTEFSFSRSEAKHTFDQRDGDYLTINCPLCKRSVTCGLTRQNYVSSLDR